MANLYSLVQKYWAWMEVAGSIKSTNLQTAILSFIILAYELA